MGRLANTLEVIVYLLIVVLGASLIWKCLNADVGLVGVMFGSFVAGLGIFLLIAKAKLEMK